MLSLISESETNIIYTITTKSKMFLEIWTICLTGIINPTFIVSKRKNNVKKFNGDSWRCILINELPQDTSKAFLSLGQ